MVNDLLARYQKEYRLALVISPSVHSPAYEQQMLQLRNEAPGFSDRDVLLGHIFYEGESRIEGDVLSHEEADALRRQFSVDHNSFRFVLIGKDGTVKYESDTPVTSLAIFEKIDEMPDRKQEVHGAAK